MIPLSHTMVLTFYLRNQIIKCAGIPEVVEDSKNYLYAQFIFSPDWAGQTKTAIFGHDNDYYEQLLGDDAICKIPYEVIKATSFTVSVVGGDRITANTVTVRVTPSGYQEGQTPEPPTPDIYEQIIEKMEQQAVDAQAALDAQHEAEEARGEAGESAEQTKEDRDAVASDKQSVENTVTNFSDVIFPNAVETIEDQVTNFSDVIFPNAVETIEDQVTNFSDVIFSNAVETIEDQVTNFSDVIFPNAVQDIEDTGDAQVLRVTQTGDAQVEAVEESGAEQTANAKEQADLAKASELLALAYKLMAISYAIGGTGERPGEDTDNSKYYKEAALQAFTDLLAMMGTHIATLTDGKLTPSQIPALSINDVFPVASEAELLALTAERGDCGIIVVDNVVTDSYILAADDPAQLENWKKLGVSYVANAGHAVTADNATNADKINNKRIVGMSQSQYDNAALDDNTFYIVTPDEV